MTSLDAGRSSDPLQTLQIQNLTKPNLPTLKKLGLLSFASEGVDQSPQHSIRLPMTTLDVGSPSDPLQTLQIRNLTKPNLHSL